MLLNRILSFTTFYYFSQRERLKLFPPSVIHPFGLPLVPGLNVIVLPLLLTGKSLFFFVGEPGGTNGSLFPCVPRPDGPLSRRLDKVL